MCSLMCRSLFVNFYDIDIVLFQTLCKRTLTLGPMSPSIPGGPGGPMGPGSPFSPGAPIKPGIPCLPSCPATPSGP